MIDPEGLASILQREYDAADAFHGELAALQRAAVDYYEARPFGNETPGNSAVVLPDVQETIDYMVPSVLELFIAGDKTVEFEATDEADEQPVEDASEAINYNFMRRQDGTRILHDGLTDGLKKKIGVFKSVCETEEKVSRETVLAPVETLAIGLPDGAEVEDAQDNGDGTVTATLKITRIEKRFLNHVIPSGEFRFSPDARHEDTADYLCHVSERTRSDLVEMGFDADQVYSLPGYSAKIGELDRDEDGQLNEDWNDESSDALQKVLLCEEYARVDVDDDGIAERVKVYRVENEILLDAETGEPSIETVDEQPFTVFCPFPRPHHLVGYSLAEKVMDLQLLRSTIARQTLDGMAYANMPRLIVDQGASDDPTTMGDILNPIPGSPIRAKGGANAVQPLQSTFNVGNSLAVMEWAKGERESRTGITALNQGMDADSINKTATGTAIMREQGQSQERFIARMFAEAVARMMMRNYRLMKAEGEPFKIKVDGEYREVNPASWPDDVNIVVRVGLGTGSKDKRLQGLMLVSNLVAQSVEAGFSTQEHAFNIIDKISRTLDVGEGADYIGDPSQMAPQQEGPSPEEQAAQAEMQMKAAEMQAKQQEAAARIDLDRQKAAAAIEVQREKHVLEMEQRREAAALEAQLGRDKAQAEYDLALIRIDQEAQLAKYKADKDGMTDQRMGGDLAS